MGKLIIASLFMAVAITAAAAQFNRCTEGFCPNVFGGGGVPPAPLTNLRITNTGDLRVTNTGDNRAVSP